MKQKINIEDVCGKYNSARHENKGRKMSREDVCKILKSSGLSEKTSLRLLSNQTTFPRYKRETGKRGVHYGYIWPIEPVHINIMKEILYPSETFKKKNNSSSKKPLSFEEECAQYLMKQGYKLKKCLGFDEARFKKDYPDLYEKYLVYKEI